jgi:SAM-dependent methyltransferase
VKPEDYYGDTSSRSSAWINRAVEPGFSPVGDIIDEAKPFLAKGGRLLDIGCQGGHQLALLADDFDEIVGIDVASYDEMWEQFEGFTFKVHDVDLGPLPFADGTFRTVIATNILEHVFDVFGLAREITRVLESGGTCLISVPNISSWRHLISLMRGQVPRTGAKEVPFNEEDGWDGQHLHYFTEREVKWLFERLGLRVIASLLPGKLAWIKRFSPRFLSGSVTLVVKKTV